MKCYKYNNTYSNPSIPGDSSYKEKKPVKPITVKEHEDTRTNGQFPMTSGSPLMKPINIENDDSDLICVNNTDNTYQGN